MSFFFFSFNHTQQLRELHFLLSMATAMASSNCLSSTIFSLSSKPQKHFNVHSRFSLFPKPSKSSLFLVSSPAPISKLALIRATSEESQSFFFENSESAGESAQADDAEAVVEAYEPEAPPEGYFPSGSFDDGPPLTEDQIAEAYEEIYGPAYSGVSVLGNDIYVMDAKFKKKGAFGKIRKGKIRDGLAERVIQVRRVTKVVKGGKQLNFRAIVVVGDRRGIVGVGVAKATEVVAAVQKSAVNARRNLITVPLTKHMTFPHRADGKYGAASVMLRPACSGTGVIAGGAVRIVLEMAGVENALGKQLGSDNALNNARATVVAIQKMRHFSEVASYRGIPIEELWK